MRHKSKLGKIATKATALALAFAMALPTSTHAYDSNAISGVISEENEEPIKVNNLQSVIDEAIEKGIPNAFIRHEYAKTPEILKTSKFELEDGEANPSVKVSNAVNDVGTEGLEIKKIDTGLLARCKIDLGEYDFGKLKANKLIYNLLVKKNFKGKGYLYLDNDDEAFAEIKLKRSGNDDWEKTKAYTVDVKKLNLTKKHNIYLRIVADDAVSAGGKYVAKTGINTNVFLESVFFMEESTPVLNFDLDSDFASIDAVNASINHTVESTGEMKTEIPENYPGGFKNATYELDYIRGRGNSTWQASKKPYKIKFNNKTDLFGMGENKHYILLANYYDYTLIRNKLTFELAKKLGLKYTPESVGVNLIINGEYFGSYQLCEQIRVGESRVDIEDLEKLKDGENPADPEIVKGGYLINMGGSWLTSDGTEERITTTPYDFVIESPKYDEDYSKEGKEAQVKYINDYFAIIQKLIDDLDPDAEGAKEENPEGKESNLNIPEGATWRDYMDEQSLIDYYLVQEFAMNYDGYRGGSTYLYKPRNGKLCWGPVWDFDFVAWDSNSTENSSSNFEGYVLLSTAPWVGSLLKNDEAFAENVSKRWKVLKPILEEAVKDGGMIDKLADEVYMSAIANYQVKRSLLMGDNEYSEYGFKGEKVNYDSNENVYTLNYTNEINRLKDFINYRISYFDETIDSILDNVSDYGSTGIAYFFKDSDDYYDDEVKPLAEVPVALKNNNGEYEAYLVDEAIPEAPEKEGYVFKGWYYYDETSTLRKYNEGDNILLVEYWGAMKRYYIPIFFGKYVEEGAAEVEKIEFISDTIYHYICTSEERLGSFDYNEGPTMYLRDLIKVEPDDALVDDLEFEVLPVEGEKEPNVKIQSGSWLFAFEPQEFILVAKVAGLEARAKVVLSEDESKFVGEEDFTIDDIELNVGEKGKVEIKYPEDKYIDYEDLTIYRYASTDSSIVEVTTEGELTAKAVGTAKIVVKKYSRNGSIFRFVNVTVKDKDTGKKPTEEVDNKKAPAVGTKLKDKTFAYKVTKAAADDAKKAGEVVVTGLVNKKATKATIKSTVTIDGYKYKITSIGKKAFKNANKLAKVTVGKNVNSIGVKAFAGLKKLTKVIIKSDKLPKIGTKAFVKKGKKVTIKVDQKLVKKAKKALKKAKCKGYKVK